MVVHFRGSPLTPARLRAAWVRRASAAWLQVRLVAPTRFIRSHYGPVLRKRRRDGMFLGLVGRDAPMIVPNVLATMDVPFVFLDVGANAGVFSLVAARMPNCTAILAFEPVPETYAVLVENIRRNGADRVRPILGAIGEGAVARLWYDPEHSGTASMVSGHGAVVEAPMLGPAELDELIEALPPQRICVKIDVEGAEPMVVRVLASTRSFGKVTDIVAEVNREADKNSAPRLIAQIEALGFRLHFRTWADAHFRRAID